MSDTNAARAAEWLKSLDPSTEQRLRDLHLQEGDILPEEFVASLREHHIRPTEWKDPKVGYVVPGEVLALLER